MSAQECSWSQKFSWVFFKSSRAPIAIKKNCNPSGIPPYVSIPQKFPYGRLKPTNLANTIDKNIEKNSSSYKQWANFTIKWLINPKNRKKGRQKISTQYSKIESITRIEPYWIKEKIRTLHILSNKNYQSPAAKDPHRLSVVLSRIEKNKGKKEKNFPPTM